MDSLDGLDQDYFIQAQDYDDDWPAHIITTVARAQAKTARVDLVLGQGGSPWRLLVELVLTTDGWKIRSVQQR